MGLLPAVTGSGTITTTPSNIDSTGYGIHHITIFLTSTMINGDTFTLETFTYNPVAAAWVKDLPESVTYTSTESGTIKSFQAIPRPGSGLRIVLTKTGGNNLNFDYETIVIT